MEMADNPREGLQKRQLLPTLRQTEIPAKMESDGWCWHLAAAHRNAITVRISKPQPTAVQLTTEGARISSEHFRVLFIFIVFFSLPQHVMI